MSAASLQVALQIATSDEVVPEGADWVLWADAALAASQGASSEPAAVTAAVTGGTADFDGQLLPIGSMTVRLVGRSESQHLNETFRHKLGPTNVLAFPGFGGENPALGVVTDTVNELGDLVICLPVVYKEAEEQGKTPLAHMAHLVVHGTLHLAGFDHEDDESAEEMECLETRVMLRLGFDDPYEADAGRANDSRIGD